MKQRTRFLIGLSLLFLFSFLPDRGYAKEQNRIDETEQRAGFTIRAEIPENQVDKAKSYFHLAIGKDHEQTIKVKIFNNTDKEQTYQILVNPAKTNKNGIIVYDDLGTPLDSSLKLPITDIVKPDNKTVTIPAWSEGEASLTIKLNDQVFSGVILGGVHISQKESEEKTQKGMSVSNRYGYVSGIALVQNAETSVFGNTELKLKKINPMVDYGSKVVEAQIQNPNAETFDKVKIEGNITKKGSQKILAEHTIDSARIAPNSFLPFQIDWGKDSVAPGTYIFEGEAKDKEKSWKFKKEFTITAKIAKEMNEQAVVKFILPDWWKQWTIICSISSVLVIGYLVYRRIHRSKKEGENE
ncbi:DUF916 and DUF3324 domain-containing protein [Enterococcus sp. AZ007]|uniref:DUF916 and DUF3324 domain-containing protein n=1 Tax=Enterococcus sp. AZ007 TaxID=2774839 RepID=UPI003F218E06